jgi:hypothetical protein
MVLGEEEEGERRGRRPKQYDETEKRREKQVTHARVCLPISTTRPFPAKVPTKPRSGQ